jgi:hypothetical protein
LEEGEVVQKLRARRRELVEPVAQEPPHPKLLLGALLLQHPHVSRAASARPLLLLLLLLERCHGQEQALHNACGPLSST